MSTDALQFLKCKSIPAINQTEKWVSPAMNQIKLSKHVKLKQDLVLSAYNQDHSCPNVVEHSLLNLLNLLLNNHLSKVYILQQRLDNWWLNMDWNSSS